MLAEWTWVEITHCSMGTLKEGLADKLAPALLSSIYNPDSTTDFSYLPTEMNMV